MAHQFFLIDDSAGNFENASDTTIGFGRNESGDLDVFPQLEDTRYELDYEIARGGMGVIYGARDHRLSRRVAVKVLRSEMVDRPEAVKSHENEALIMSSLSHPGVTPVYDTGVGSDGRPFYVMKLVEGRTLAEILEDGRESQASLLSMFYDVCQTMAYAHANHIVHLDLKPKNVMVGEFGEVHVMDWGLARRLKSDFLPSVRSGESEAMHDIQGTLEYMSPEQARGESLDSRSDVFTLGAILFRILTGLPLYAGRNFADTHSMAMNGVVHASLLVLEKTDADPILIRLVGNCLSSNRDSRPRDAQFIGGQMGVYQESLLQRVQNDMNRFFELSLDMFCIAGFDGFFRRVNPNFSRVLGHSEATLLSQPFLNFIHPDDRKGTVTTMSVLLSGEPVVRFCNRYMAIDDRLVTLEWTAKAIPDENLIFAVARDITEAGEEVVA